MSHPREEYQGRLLFSNRNCSPSAKKCSIPSQSSNPFVHPSVNWPWKWKISRFNRTYIHQLNIIWTFHWFSRAFPKEGRSLGKGHHLRIWCVWSWQRYLFQPLHLRMQHPWRWVQDPPRCWPNDLRGKARWRKACAVPVGFQPCWMYVVAPWSDELAKKALLLSLSSWSLLEKIVSYQSLGYPSNKDQQATCKRSRSATCCIGYVRSQFFLLGRSFRAIDGW